MTKTPDIYLVRRTPAVNAQPNTYEIAKFTDSNHPTDTYQVTYDQLNGRAWCSCMGFRSMQYEPFSNPKCRDHKHIKIVAESRRLKEPWLCAFWLDKENNVQHNEFALPLQEFLNGI